MITGAENRNQFWAELIVEELSRLGVDTFCVSPGSRSSPLSVAISRHPLVDSVVHYDERGAAFFALGHARATGRPVAWITTSGTAAANGLPAFVEAAADGIPLILLTADRPPEQRQSGANQTIDQVGLFGKYVRWEFDLPTPDPSLDPAFVLTTVDQAVHRSTRDLGPVHLNCQFREPLAPVPEPGFEMPLNPAFGRWLEGSGPFTVYAGGHTGIDRDTVEAVVEELTKAAGIVVAGRLRGESEGEAVMSVAEALGWPVVADVLSCVSSESASVPVIRGIDLLLKSDEFREAFLPSTVLHFGGRITSKRFYQRLAATAPACFILVSPLQERIDPVHRVTRRLEADVRSFGEALVNRVHSRGRQRRGAADEEWIRLARVAQTSIEPHVISDVVTEPGVARTLTGKLPHDHALFVAASMPIRDLDSFGVFAQGGLVVAANRGASGIDGTVASAAGYSRGRGGPVTLLTGDLALLHDLNSLALLRTNPFPVIVVVINNDGGGVFSFLPIAESREHFEQFFGTPHGFSFEGAAGLFRLSYENPDSIRSFGAAYEAACESGRSAVIEVKTDREQNFRVHQTLSSTVNEAIRFIKTSSVGDSARDAR